MGKPKKSIEDKKSVRAVLGKKIRYIGVGGARMTCDCGRSIKKGMISEYHDKFYCSEDCIHAQQKLSGVS